MTTENTQKLIDELKLCLVNDNHEIHRWPGHVAELIKRTIIHLEHIDWLEASKAPLNVWLLTRKEGEDGYNVTRRIHEDEWADREGRTTVTHHSFAAPTHFLWGHQAVEAFCRRMNNETHPLITVEAK